jgi:hypothetical protein
MSVPSFCVELRVEGRALAYALDCASDEDERRLVLDLEMREDVLGEIAIAVDEFLIEHREGSS